MGPATQSTLVAAKSLVSGLDQLVDCARAFGREVRIIPQIRRNGGQRLWLTRLAAVAVTNEIAWLETCPTRKSGQAIHIGPPALRHAGQSGGAYAGLGRDSLPRHASTPALGVQRRIKGIQVKMAPAHLNFTFATDMLYCNCSINAIVRQFRKEMVMESAAPPVQTDLVQIRVNDMSVTVPHEVTGLQIKEAAIAAGVPIQLDFVLSLELGHGKTKIVTDSESISVHQGSEFVAVAPDDNS